MGQMEQIEIDRAELALARERQLETIDAAFEEIAGSLKIGDPIGLKLPLGYNADREEGIHPALRERNDLSGGLRGIWGIL